MIFHLSLLFSPICIDRFHWSKKPIADFVSLPVYLRNCSKRGKVFFTFSRWPLKILLLRFSFLNDLESWWIYLSHRNVAAGEEKCKQTAHLNGNLVQIIFSLVVVFRLLYTQIRDWWSLLGFISIRVKKACKFFFPRLTSEMCQIMQSLGLRTTLPTWIHRIYLACE